MSEQKPMPLSPETELAVLRDVTSDAAQRIGEMRLEILDLRMKLRRAVKGLKPFASAVGATDCAKKLLGEIAWTPKRDKQLREYPLAEHFFHARDLVEELSKNIGEGK